MKNEDLATSAGTLVVLGILFGEDLLIGYSFIFAGIVLAIITAIKSKRQFKREKPSHP